MPCSAAARVEYFYWKRWRAYGAIKSGPPGRLQKSPSSDAQRTGFSFLPPGRTASVTAQGARRFGAGKGQCGKQNVCICPYSHLPSLFTTRFVSKRLNIIPTGYAQMLQNSRQRRHALFGWPQRRRFGQRSFHSVFGGTGFYRRISTGTFDHLQRVLPSSYKSPFRFFRTQVFFLSAYLSAHVPENITPSM